MPVVIGGIAFFLIVFASVVSPFATFNPLVSPSPWLNNSNQQGGWRFDVAFPTYQLGSWSGGGTWLVSGPNVVDDTIIQQNYISTASLLYPWGGIGYAGWCNGANTSVTSISNSHYGSGSIYSPNIAALLVKYEMPYFIQEPLDAYGACQGWVTDVTNAHPDLETWDSSAKVTPYYVRVDDINFSLQIYNDLINLYHNLVQTDPRLINLWQGIDISSIGADMGGYPKPGSGPPRFMYGANSILDFATSPLCTSYYSTCSALAQSARSVTNGTSLSLINQLLSRYTNQYDIYTNVEFLLGLSYAAYNFSQNYLGGRPFVVAPAYSVYVNPSQYPYPYNSSAIQNLNLLQKLQLDTGAYVENGNQPTSSTVKTDIGICSSLSPYGNQGAFLTSTVTNPQWFYQYIRNTMYFMPNCISSVMEPGNVNYGNTADPSFQLLMGFGTLLNRMINIGNTITASPTIIASDPSTGVRIIQGNGVALAWFYTNKTSTENVSIILNTVSMGIKGPWIAISALDWQVLAEGSNSSVNLSLSIPATGWNPVYILPQVSDLQPVYTNLPIKSYSIASGVANFTTSGPHDFSGWMVLSLNSTPTVVSTSNQGSLPYYSSLDALNNTFIGMKYINGAFQNMTQAGWYYDLLNHLLYIHYIGDNNVRLTVKETIPNQAKGMNIILGSSQLVVALGGNTSIPIEVTMFGTGSQITTLSAQQVPQGIAIQFKPGSGYTNFTSELSIEVSSVVPLGNYSISIAAIAKNLMATTQLSLSIISALNLGNGSNRENQENNSTNEYTVRISSGPVGFGSTNPDSGLYTLKAGTIVNITSHPSPGWELGSWYVNGQYAGNGSRLSFAVLSDTTVFALFIESSNPLPTATISISSNIINGNVTVDGRNFHTPVSFSWVIGTNHTITVESFKIFSNEQILFERWSGSLDSKSQNMSITVRDDIYLTAEYAILYYVKINFVDTRSMPITPTIALLNYSNGITQLNGNFSFWGQGGTTYKLIGATWAGTGVSSINSFNGTFTVSSSRSYTITLNIHPLTMRVQDIFGQPLPGVKIWLLLPNGSETVEITNSSGYAYFAEVPENGYLAKASYLGNVFTLYPDQGANDIQYLTMVFSYPVLGGIVAVFVSLGFSLLFRKIKKGVFLNLRNHEREIADKNNPQ